MSREESELEMAIEHHHLIAAGLLDPGQPTPYSHLLYQRRMRAEFTPRERAEIRSLLGIDVARAVSSEQTPQP